jgi:hypothetical protein
MNEIFGELRSLSQRLNLPGSWEAIVAILDALDPVEDHALLTEQLLPYLHAQLTRSSSELRRAPARS